MRPSSPGRRACKKDRHNYPVNLSNEKEVIAYCKEHLAGYKCPKTVDFWESLPLNPMGKILKREIRNKYWKGQEVKI